MYQGDVSPPDILILVDDVTSVVRPVCIISVLCILPVKYSCMYPMQLSQDIGKVKRAVLQAKNKDIRSIRFLTPHGGFGTFFSKADIQRMSQPIFCDQ